MYRLGDQVRVQIVRVDMERRQIDLGLDDVLEKVRRDERSRGPSRSSSRMKKDHGKRGSAFAKASAGPAARHADRRTSEREAAKKKKKKRLGRNERKRLKR